MARFLLFLCFKSKLSYQRRNLIICIVTIKEKKADSLKLNTFVLITFYSINWNDLDVKIRKELITLTNVLNIFPTIE